MSPSQSRTYASIEGRRIERFSIERRTIDRRSLGFGCFRTGLNTDPKTFDLMISIQQVGIQMLQRVCALYLCSVHRPTL